MNWKREKTSRITTVAWELNRPIRMDALGRYGFGLLREDEVDNQDEKRFLEVSLTGLSNGRKR